MEKGGKIFGKKGLEMNVLGYIILGLIGLAIAFVGYFILTGKLSSAGEFIKNLFRFGK